MKSELDIDEVAAGGTRADVELRSGAVRVRPATRELEVGGEPVAIERRAFDLLVHLMRHAERVVDKDELLCEVWLDRPVSESTVAQAVSRVRRALGGETDAWIATVYGVGYRFTRAVTVMGRTARPGDERGSSSASTAARHGWLRHALVPVLGLVLAALLAVAWINLQRPDASELRVAVLPVQNETGDAQLDWVQLGVLPLIDRALAEGGVRRIETSQVLSTLRRYPEANDSTAQARVLRFNTRVDRVLVPRLYVADSGYRLEVRSADDANDSLDFELQGDDVAVLAVAAGATLAESLSRWQGSQRARRGLVTDDPFVNEAFARGLDARLRGRWEDAARFFDTVLAAAPDLLDAKYHLALVTRRLGDWDYTEQLHEELRAAAEAQGDLGMLAAVQSVSGTLAWRRGDKAAAERWYRQALANYTEQGNADYIASTRGNLGILAATRGEFATAERQMRAALAHYESSGDRFNEATTLKNIGNLQVDQGRYDEAEATLNRSLDIRRTLELPLQVAMTLSVLADVEMARGDWDQALAYQQRVLEAAEEHRSPVLAIQAQADLSSVLRRTGRLAEAVDHAAAAHARAVELGSRSNQAFALVQQAHAELDRRRADHAAGLFERAASIYAEIDQPQDEAGARIGQGLSLLEAGRPGRARSELERGRAVLAGLETHRLASSLARAEARFSRAEGDLAAAAARLEAAYRSARDAQVPIDVLDVGGELGLALLEIGAPVERVDDLARVLADGADASAVALDFLSRAHADTDPVRAVQLAQRRRDLLGEGWTAEDEAWLEDLRTRAGNPART